MTLKTSLLVSAPSPFVFSFVFRSMNEAMQALEEEQADDE